MSTEECRHYDSSIEDQSTVEDGPIDSIDPSGTDEAASRYVMNSIIDHYY